MNKITLQQLTNFLAEVDQNTSAFGSAFDTLDKELDDDGPALATLSERAVGLSNRARVWKSRLIEDRLRSEGWKPVREVLMNFEWTPALDILGEINSRVFGKAADALSEYAEAGNAFYNEDQACLLEVGTWSELFKHTSEEDEKPL